jgi:hypothetical protein
MLVPARGELVGVYMNTWIMIVKIPIYQEEMWDKFS